MYTIGQFALILKISTRTLRHYDDIGILKPQYIKEDTGYRYYDKEQLVMAKNIVKLKENGLSLEEIKEILIENKNYREILEKRLDYIKNDILRLVTMKESLEKLLIKDFTLGEEERINKQYDIKIVEIDDINVISKKCIINIKDVGEIVGSLYEMVNKNGLRVNGGHIIKYFTNEFDPENADIEVCLPVESRKECKIKFKRICKGRYVKITVNSITEKGEAYVNIINWIRENNLIIDGNPFEQYFIDGKSKRFTIDIFYPVK